jgi:hypothetical protein
MPRCIHKKSVGAIVTAFFRHYFASRMNAVRPRPCIAHIVGVTTVTDGTLHTL